MINPTLMINPNMLPFKIGAIHSFPLYHYILGDTATDHGNGIWIRPAVLLSRKGAYAETRVRTRDEKDVSRPVVLSNQHSSCILCNMEVPHTTSLHQYFIEELA